MKPEILQAIKGRRRSANMDTISAAVRAYPDHNADDAFFAEWVGDDIDALIAEVERLRAALNQIVAVERARSMPDRTRAELSAALKSANA